MSLSDMGPTGPVPKLGMFMVAQPGNAATAGPATRVATIVAPPTWRGAQAGSPTVSTGQVGPATATPSMPVRPVAPGFGQAYNGHFLKGIVFAVVAVLAWVGLLNLGILNGKVTGWFLPSLLALAGVYLVAIIDAAVVAGKHGVTVRPTRPTPPVDKPFE